jgi:hypothetical protein
VSEREEIAFVRSSMRDVACCGGCGSVAVGVLLAQTAARLELFPWQQAGSGGVGRQFSVLALGLAFALLLVIAVYGARRVLGHGPALVLDHEGVVFDSTLAGTVFLAWSEIRELEIEHGPDGDSQPMLVALPREELDMRERLSLWQRGCLGLGIRPWSVPFGVVALPLQDLKTRMEAAKHRAESNQ